MNHAHIFYTLKSNTLTLALLLFTPLAPLFSQDYSNFSQEFFEKQEFAHRGGYAKGPENSIQTIIESTKLDINAIEIDIRMTKDSHLIIFHDQTIERVLQCDEKLAVADLTLSQIRTYPFRDTVLGELYVGTVEDLLDTLGLILSDSQKRDLLLELDFKPHGQRGLVATERLVNILHHKNKIFGDMLYNHFFIATFYPDILKEVQKRDPKIKTAFAVNNKPRKNKFLANLAILFSPGIVKNNKVSIYEPNMCMVTPALVKKWRKKGILINAWTANNQCEKDYLRKLNVAFTSNCPHSECPREESDQVGKSGWCKKCAKN